MFKNITTIFFTFVIISTKLLFHFNVKYHQHFIHTLKPQPSFNSDILFVFHYHREKYFGKKFIKRYYYLYFYVQNIIKMKKNHIELCNVMAN